MVAADPTRDERRLLDALWTQRVLETPTAERFDRITRMARRLFGVPIAIVRLLDEHRRWFTTSGAVGGTEAPRDTSFCDHAILADAPLVVPNALEDARFAASALVQDDPGVRFYAGWPLKAPSGERVGALCLIAPEPRTLNGEDLTVFADLAALVEHELAAVQLAALDPLTGVTNRRGFTLLAEQTLRFCRRQRIPMSLVFTDLDDLKALNDRLGHAAGDRALVTFATHMRGAARDMDVVGRLGGDEFALLLVAATKPQAVRVTERLRASLAAPADVAERGFDIGFSHGVVAFDRRRDRSIVDLLARSDALMYRMKRTKR